MARRGVFVPIIGDPGSLIRALKESKTELRTFGSEAQKVSSTVAGAADRQVRATVALDARLRQQAVRYREIAAAAQKGSREQIAAANLAVKAEERLARSLAVTAKEANAHAKSIKNSERELSRFGRGAFAGSGLASGLGRSLAFASGGFLATASVTAFLRDSIDQGSKAAATQKQLAAQFRQSGQSLAKYQEQIDSATNSLSHLAGIEDDELKAAFTTAFRATNDVTTSLKIQATAADVARGRHISLAQASLALTKAYTGQNTALRRLGVTVPKNLKGMQALEFVQRKFAGQAAAGATAQDRFRAALANTEETIGVALLPSLNKLLNHLSNWLSKEENQKKIQHDVNQSLKVTSAIVHDLAKAYGLAATAAGEYNKIAKAAGHLPGPLATLGKVLFQPGYGLSQVLKAFGGPPGRGSSVVQTPPGDVRGTYGYGPSSAANPGGFVTAAQLRALGLDPATYGKGPSTASNPGGFLPLKKATAGGGTTVGPLGLRARLAKAQLAVAKAAITKGAADDRAALVAEAKIIREEVASNKKAFRDKTSLYNTLASVLGQIDQIDATAANDRADKAKKAAEDAKKARAKEAAIRKKGIADALADTKKAAEQAKQQRDTIQNAVDAARSAIGDLFTGSFFNPTDAQQKRALGAPNPQANARNLTKDLQSQIKAYKAFSHDLAALGKRGAPAELLAELRAQGLSAAPEVHALATAGRGTLGQFLKAFGQREALVAKTAKATLAANRVEVKAQRLVVNAVAGKDLWKPTVYVYVDGKERKVRVKTTPHAQTRGRNPGVVPSSIGSFVR